MPQFILTDKFIRVDNTRRAATEERRRQITSAAITLLAEHGYQAATFDAIRRTAGLSSKRLITYHFSGKEELFAAIAEQIVTESEAYVQQAIAGITDPRDLLTAVIRAGVAFIATHTPHVRALQQIVLNGGAGTWEQYHLQSQNRLAELFAEGQRTGAFRPADPRVMAAALRAAIDSTAALVSSGIDPGRCADDLAALFHHGTTKEKP